MKHLFHILLIGILTTSAWAQDAAVDEPQEERRYTVEMIIFAYTRDVATAGEIFVPDPPVAEESLEGMSPEPTGQLPELEFVRLDPGDFTMGDVMGHLRRIDIYRPLMHFGWTQTTLPEELTRPIRLSSLARPAPGLDGTLQLYLSRFLHLVVDLEMEAGRSSDANTLGLELPVHYRIQEDRIFRSGELRYFDHPKFGVLARITRVEA